MKRSLTVTVVSETPFTVQGQGVHSAFVDMVHVLKRKGCTVNVNGSTRADVVHVHTVGAYSLWKLLLTRGPRVISAHIVPDSLKGSLRFTRLWLPLFSRYLRFFYNRADALVAVSPYTARELEKMRVKPRVVTIPNSVNRVWFHPDETRRHAMRAKLHIRPEEFVVIASGQVQERKGVATFSELAEALPAVHFLWVGGRPFGRFTAGYAHMDAIIASAPKNLTFVGEVPYEKMPGYYNASDLFFLPSHQETFGLVVTEAAASGLPILLRDLAEYKLSFAPWYAAASDNAGFIREIRQFMDDSAYTEEAKKKAGEIAHKFDSATIGDQLIALYESLISHRQPS